MAHEEVLDTSFYRSPARHWFHGSVSVLRASLCTDIPLPDSTQEAADQDSQFKIDLAIVPPWWAFWRTACRVSVTARAHLYLQSGKRRWFTGTDWRRTDGAVLSAWLTRVCDSVSFVLAGARLPEPDRAR